jgi:hypothetical protein
MIFTAEVSVASGVVFLIFFVGHFLYSVKVFLEVDFLPVPESPFGIEFLFGYDVIRNHMMSDFASEFVSEVGEGFGEDLRCGGGDSFVLFFLFLFGFLFFNFLDFVFDVVEGIENSSAIGSILVDVSGVESFPRATDVVADCPDKGEYESEQEEEGDKACGCENEDVSEIVELGEFD